MTVVRKCICIPPTYTKKLKNAAKKLQISESELIRRAIDDYLIKVGINPVIEEGE